MGFATFAVLDFWCCGTPALVYPMKGDKIVAGRGDQRADDVGTRWVELSCVNVLASIHES